MGKLEQEIVLVRYHLVTETAEPIDNCYTCAMHSLETQLRRSDPVYTQSVKEFALRHARANDTFMANFGSIIDQLSAVKLENK